MIENKVANYSVINLNTATLIQDGKPTNSVYPFNDLDSIMDFMCNIIEPFISRDIQHIIATKYYMVVDKDCNKYTFDIVQNNLVLYSNLKPVANRYLENKYIKGDC